jgi:hypothetical protein
MQRMTLVLARSAEQESALRVMLDEQQTKGSANFHQWLSPVQFGKQFGAPDSDVAAVKAWLESHGFQVTAISKGRIAIEFSGTAAQVEEAFHTAIHKYELNGEEHWANSSDPSIPAAMAPAVKGILSLHNFPRHTQFTLHAARASKAQRSPETPPLFTYTSGNETFHGLGPTDFATIYNVLPLWNAGIDGTGQTIAIVGETDIHLSDIEAFRSLFNLPAKDPVVIVNGADPGIVGDEPEAVLDVSWSGAVAKNATIDLVVSASTETALGVDLSALYIVDNNLAPVMSESYGICEATLGNAGNAFYNALWQQAAAEGITVAIAAGDGGSAGCDNFDAQEFALAGLAVSGFASTPYNVAVGGTDFNQTATTASQYWSATNDATTGASALGYIPETTWNQSCADLGLGQCSTSGNDLDIVAGSGGPSSCSTQDSSGNCVSGYSKPAWQTGTGVPADGVRDLPDVSLFASAGFNGSFYIMCEEDINGGGFFSSSAPCSLVNDTFVGIGGTSAAAPSFAGIMALVNQKTSARQGNANYTLYRLAAQNNASCNASTAAATGNSCIFYDITQGNDSVPCFYQTPDCAPSTGTSYGILVDPNNTSTPAWTTTAGYDLATGLGSVNANNLVNAWSAVTFTPSVTTLTSLSPVNLVHGQAVNVTATAAAKSGGGTPTGSIELMAAPSGSAVAAGEFTLANGVASGTTALLPAGTYNVTAHYAGDATFGASDSAPMEVTVGKENSQMKLSLAAFNPTTGTFSDTSTIPYGSIFFLRGDVTGASGTLCGPNPQQSGVGCPTGSVSFSNGGKAVDAGSYVLNNLGYAEDQSVSPEFNTLGSYSLSAQYGGDSSYNSSSTTLTATTTQASTFMYIDTSLGLNVSASGSVGATAYAGESFFVDAPVFAYSIQQAPSGSITWTENGAAPTGVISTTPRNGAFTGNYSSGEWQWAYLAGYVTQAIDTPGTYTFNASYPGDAYYGPSQSPSPLVVTVLDTTFTIVSPIPNVTIAAGKTGTVALGLTDVDNFYGTVTVTCTLPATMSEATCASAGATMNAASTTATVTVTTTAPHTEAVKRASAEKLYGLGALACVLLLWAPRGWRRRIQMAMLLLVCVAGFAGCGGSGVPAPPPVTDPGTAAGTYTVTVTAAAANITRTGTFTVTVQ